MSTASIDDVPASAPALGAPALGWRDYVRTTTLAFWGVHIAAIVGVFYLGWSWHGFALAIGAYFVRMVGVTAGYHRYFAHRAFKTGRAFQFLLAVAAATRRKGAAVVGRHHRHHHKHSDTAEDIHSPKRRGFWYSHVGWVMGPPGTKPTWTLCATWPSTPSCAG